MRQDVSQIEREIIQKREQYKELGKLDFPAFVENYFDAKQISENKFLCPFHDNKPEIGFWLSENQEWLYTERHENPHYLNSGYVEPFIDLVKEREGLSSTEGVIQFIKKKMQPRNLVPQDEQVPSEQSEESHSHKDENNLVFLVKKNLDVSALKTLGFIAINSPRGMGHDQLRGKVICICIGSSTEAEKRARELGKIAAEVKIIELPGSSRNRQSIAAWLEMKGDISEGEKRRMILEITEQTSEFNGKQGNNTEASAEGELILTPFSDIEAKKIEWLWFKRFPRGMLSLIVGDPGIGKSCLAMYIASRISRGDYWPDTKEQPEKGSVHYLTTEDSPECVLKKRILVNEGNPEKICHCPGIRKEEGFFVFDITKHLPNLEKGIKSTPDLKAIIIDPIAGHLGGKINSNDATQVRNAMGPLAQLAEKYNLAIIGITHLSKTNLPVSAIYRILGSLQFTALARVIWLVTKDSQNTSSEDRRLLISIKHNINIAQTSLAWLPEKSTDPENDEFKLIFESEPIGKLDATEILNLGIPRTPREKAKMFLADKLKDGPGLRTEILDAAKKEGIKLMTLERARRDLKILSRPPETFGGRWKWFLPGNLDCIKEDKK